jgi:hypothetical protein
MYDAIASIGDKAEPLDKITLNVCIVFRYLFVIFLFKLHRTAVLPLSYFCIVLF